MRRGEERGTSGPQRLIGTLYHARSKDAPDRSIRGLPVGVGVGGSFEYPRGRRARTVGARRYSQPVCCLRFTETMIRLTGL